MTTDVTPTQRAEAHYLFGLHDRTKSGPGRMPTRKIAKILDLEPSVITGLASSRAQDDLGDLPTVHGRRRKELREAFGVVDPPTKAAEPGTDLVATSSPHPVDEIDWAQVTVTVTANGQEAPVLPPMPVVELIHMAAKSAYDLGEARAQLAGALDVVNKLQRQLDDVRADAEKYRSVAALELTRNGVHG